jgi:hypothetical protein
MVRARSALAEFAGRSCGRSEGPGQRQLASNTTLDDGSDIYVANRGDNMSQDGSVIAVRRVNVPNGPLNNSALNGIASSIDGKTIYVTFTRPSQRQGGILALPAF